MRPVLLRRERIDCGDVRRKDTSRSRAPRTGVPRDELPGIHSRSIALVRPGAPSWNEFRLNNARAPSLLKRPRRIAHAGAVRARPGKHG